MNLFGSEVNYLAHWKKILMLFLVIPVAQRVSVETLGIYYIDVVP